MRFILLFNYCFVRAQLLAREDEFKPDLEPSYEDIIQLLSEVETKSVGSNYIERTCGFLPDFETRIENYHK